MVQEYDLSGETVSSWTGRILQAAETAYDPLQSDEQRAKASDSLTAAIAGQDNFQGIQPWVVRDNPELAREYYRLMRTLEFVPRRRKWMQTLAQIEPGQRVPFEIPGDDRETFIERGLYGKSYSLLYETSKAMGTVAKFPMGDGMDGAGVRDYLLHAGKTNAPELLHELGLEPIEGVDNIVRPDGTVNGQVARESDRRWYHAMPGLEPEGYRIPEWAEDTPAFTNDPKVHRSAAIIHNEVHTSDDGSKFIVYERPDEVPEIIRLPTVSMSGQVRVPDGKGGQHMLNVDETLMDELTSAERGGVLGHSIAGHFFYVPVTDGLPSDIRKAEWVTTAYGEQLLPKITGNKELDRELMRDPLWQRAVQESSLEAPWQIPFYQALYNIGEFAAVQYATGMVGKGVGRAAMRLGKNRMGVQAFGRFLAAAGEGTARSRTAIPGLRFDVWQVGEEIWYEAVRGVITGDGTVSDWVKSGGQEGLGELAIGKSSRALRRSAGRVLRAVRRRDLVPLETRMLVRGQQAATSAFDEGREAMQVAAKRMLEKTYLRELDAQAWGETWDAMTIGLAFGAYDEGQRLAAKRGEEFNASHFLEAMVSSNLAHSSAAAFVVAMQGQYQGRRLFAAKSMLTPEQQAQLRDMSDALSMLAVDLSMDPEFAESAIGIFSQVENQEEFADLLDARLEAVRGGDPARARSMDIEQVGEIISREGGSEALEQALTTFSDEELDQVESQVRNLPIAEEPTTSRIRTGKAIMELVGNERRRREAGGQYPAIAEPMEEGPRKPQGPRDIPPDALPFYFTERVVPPPIGSDEPAQVSYDLRKARTSVWLDTRTGQWWIVNRRNMQPIEERGGPYDELEEAMRSALELTPPRALDDTAAEFRRKEPVDPVPSAGIPPEATPELSPEAQRIAEDWRASRAARADEQAEATRKALEEELTKEDLEEDQRIARALEKRLEADRAGVEEQAEQVEALTEELTAASASITGEETVPRGTIDPPTLEEYFEAAEKVYAALRWVPRYRGMSRDEIVDRWIRDRDLAGTAALEERVGEALTLGAKHPRPRRRPRRETSRRTRTQTEAEVKAGLRGVDPLAAEAAEALMADESLSAARPEARQDEPPPLGEPAWATDTGRAALEIGARAFDRTKRQENLTDATRQALVAGFRMQRAMAEGRPADAQVARLELEAVTTGMLLSLGGQGGRWVDLVAGLTGQSTSAVESVRQNLIRRGAQNDARIAQVLAEKTDAKGNPLITRGQMRQPETQELLRLASLELPAGVKFRPGSETSKPEASVLTRLEKSLRDIAPALAQEAGVREANLEATLFGEEGFLGQARKALRGLGRAKPRDVFGRLMARVAYTTLGRNQHKAGASRKIPSMGDQTLGQVTSALLESLRAGQPVEFKLTGHRTESLEQFRTDPDSSLEDVVGEGVSGIEERTSDETPETEIQRYQEASELAADAWSALLRVRLPNGSWLVPRNERGAPISMPNDPVDFTHGNLATSLMRSLYEEAPWLRRAFETAVDPETGTPSFVDPDTAWRNATMAAQASAEYMQSLLLSRLRSELGEESAHLAEAVLEALQSEASKIDGTTARAADATMRSVPPELAEILRRGDGPNGLFPQGALIEGTTILDPSVESRLMQFANDSFKGVIDEAMGLEGVEAINEYEGYQFLYANPLQALAGWALDFVPRVGRDYEKFSARGKVGLFKILRWMTERNPLWGETPLFSKQIASGLARWAAAIGRPKRSQALPKRVRDGNVTMTQMRVGMSERYNRFLDRSRALLEEIRSKNLTGPQRVLIGRAIDAQAWRKFQNEKEWVEVFGEENQALFGVLNDMVSLFNDLGRDLVAEGVITEEQYRELEGSYLPRLYLDPNGAYNEDLRRMTGMQLGGFRGTGREFSRTNHADMAEVGQRVYDVGYILPIVTAQEAARGRLYGHLNRLVGNADTYLTREQYERLPLHERPFFRKLTEPIGGRWVPESELLTTDEALELKEGEKEHVRRRRRGASVAQVKLHQWVRGEREAALSEGGPPLTETKEELFGKLEEGYVSTAALYEVDILLDELDPGEAHGGEAFIQQLTLYWRRLRTIQNPRHWVLNFTTSIVTNHITGKVSMLDFIKSMVTGEGLYADTARGLFAWETWVKNGRKEEDLDPADPSTLDILLTDSMAQRLGGSTFVASVFHPVSVADQILEMFQGQPPDLGSTSPRGQLVSAAALGLTRRGRATADLDATIAKYSGSPNPESQAEAIRSLQGLYQLHELFFKIAAAKNGMRAGMDIDAATHWAAEGSGDYSDRNPWVYRWTTQFFAGVPQAERQARTTMKQPLWRQRLPMLMRLGLGSPFWMYRASMWPTVAESTLNRPMKVAVGYLAVSFATRAMSAIFGGEEEELQEAHLGHEQLFDRNLSPEAVDILAQRYGNLEVGGWANASLPSRFRMQLSRWARYWKAMKDTGLYVGTFGAAGERSADAPMVYSGRGPELGGRTTRIDMGEFMGANTPVISPRGLNTAADTIHMLRNWNQGHPLWEMQERMGANNIGIGFLALTAFDTLSSTVGAVQGKKGETRSETWMKYMLDLMAAWSAPGGGGPTAFASREGQEAVRIFQWGGRSWDQIIDGIPDPRVENEPITRQLAVLGVRNLIPVRRTPGYAATKRPLNKAEAFFAANNVRIPEAISGDAMKDLETRVTRTLKKAMVKWWADVYQEQRSLAAPPEAIALSYFGLEAELEPGPDGGWKLKDKPKSALGRAIAGQPESEQPMWIDASLAYLHNTSREVERVLLPMMRRRDADPAIVERVARAVWESVEDPGKVLDLVYERRGDTENLGIWYQLWRDAGLGTAQYDSPGSRQRQAALRKLFTSADQAALMGPSSPAVLGGELPDIAPRAYVEALPVVQENPYPNLLKAQ